MACVGRWRVGMLGRGKTGKDVVQDPARVKIQTMGEDGP